MLRQLFVYDGHKICFVQFSMAIPGKEYLDHLWKLFECG
jgi:hypothetical protein